MKRLLLGFAGILSVVLFYTACYYLSFQSTVRKLEQEKKQQDTELSRIINGEEAGNNGTGTADGDGMGTADADGAEAEDAAVDDFSIITSDTVCVYELYYIDTGESHRYESPPGSDIAGLTREQLTDKLRHYMDNLSVTEYEEGLISYELVSFSSDRVVLQKVYDRTRIRFKYYVTLRNEEIIVYYSDKKTIYEYTGIPASQLDAANRAALQDGIGITDAETLYDFLAGLTS